MNKCLYILKQYRNSDVEERVKVRGTRYGETGVRNLILGALGDLGVAAGAG